MKLYIAPGACSFASHVVLHEAGIACDIVRVNLKTHQYADGADFYKINPKGYVPALQLDSGELLTEGTAILPYLADLKPETGLAPKAGTLERYRLQEWLGFINSEVHKSFGPLFYPAPEETKAAVKANLAKRYAFIDAHLKTHDFLLGKAFSVADAYLFTTLSWCGHVGVDLSAYPALSAYFQKVGERPAVKAARAAEA